MAEETASRFTEEDRFLLDVEQRADFAQMYPDGPEAHYLRERARLAELDPEGAEAWEIGQEARLSQLYAKESELDRLQDQINNREVVTEVTPEQKERVDQALGNVELSNQIGGAYEAGDKPMPNDPTPMDRARDIGNDLHRSGLTMDREK